MSETPERDFYEGQQVDPEDQLQPSDTLDGDELDDVLDQGYSPPDREPRDGSVPAANLDEWLAQEEPDLDPELPDAGVADRRTGRLVAPDEGLGEDVDKDEVAWDVGIDGAGASAEEAAVHVIDDELDEPTETDWG